MTVLTVGVLRRLLEGHDDAEAVIVHVGQDTTVHEWEIDPDDGILVLYPDFDKAGVATVNADWLAKIIADEPKP